MSIAVVTGQKLAYRNEVLKYNDTNASESNTIGYQTDILVRDELGNGLWVPRAVIECKLASVTTHDALTYSSKADTHKQVHPYLRYGILIGSRGEKAVPRRLFRHGAYFDFMAAWKGNVPSDEERKGLIDVLREEIEASRQIEKLVSQNCSKYSLVHRRLILKTYSFRYDSCALAGVALRIGLGLALRYTALFAHRLRPSARFWELLGTGRRIANPPQDPTT